MFLYNLTMPKISIYFFIKSFTTRPCFCTMEYRDGRRLNVCAPSSICSFAQNNAFDHLKATAFVKIVDTRLFVRLAFLFQFYGAWYI